MNKKTYLIEDWLQVMVFEIWHALHEEEAPGNEETFLSKGIINQSIYL